MLSILDLRAKLIQMISIAQLAWKYYFLFRLFFTYCNIIVGFVCITLPILILFPTSSFLLPIRLLVSFRVRSLDDIYRWRLRRHRHWWQCLHRRRVCKYNCCNWFSSLVVLASINLTSPLAWGPSFGLAKSTLNLGASGRIFLRTPDWEYISSNCWALKIACSSMNTPESDISLDILGCKDLRNHSRRNSCGILALMSLFLLLHSWIWSELYVAWS